MNHFFYKILVKFFGEIRVCYFLAITPPSILGLREAKKVLQSVSKDLDKKSQKKLDILSEKWCKINGF